MLATPMLPFMTPPSLAVTDQRVAVNIDQLLGSDQLGDVIQHYSKFDVDAAYSGTPIHVHLHMYILMHKAEPLRCLALRTRGGIIILGSYTYLWSGFVLVQTRSYA